MKKCYKCGEVKPVSEFYSNRAKIDLLTTECRSCVKINTKNYLLSKLGLVTKIYSRQKSASKQRGHNPPTYSKQEFLDFCFASPMFHKLYDEWVKSVYDTWKVPSFDRKDDYKGYSFENFNKWMTWKENFYKGHSDRRNGINNKDSKAVIGTHKITGKTIEFYSMIEAYRQTGIHYSNISDCCLGKKKKDNKGLYYIPSSAGGYKWKFKN